MFPSSSSMELIRERKPHVLAVDDEIVARKVNEKLLINSAFRVTKDYRKVCKSGTRVLGTGTQEYCGVWRNKCMEEGAEELMKKPIQKSDVKKLRGRMKEFSNPQKYFEWEEKKTTPD